MSKDALERRIQAIEALRSAPDTAAEPLRKALRDRNNYLVSRAAAVAGSLGLGALVPDLLAAFDRFLEDSVKSDPQCWAKNAIVKALRELGHSDPEVFLKGLAHVQPEPVWGGRADTATTLRGECALALGACQLDDLTVLRHLTDALADPETPVRVNAARAVGQLGRPEGALLLRLKVLLGDSEPEVTGECFAELVRLSGAEGVSFVARYLSSADEAVRGEAAAALGQSEEPSALEMLRQRWKLDSSAELKRVIVLSLGASTNPAAAEFLLSVIADASVELAAAAIEALSSSRFRSGVREQVAEAVARRGGGALQKVFSKEFGTKAD